MSLLVFKNRIFSILAYFFPFIRCYSVGNVTRKYKIQRIKTDSVNTHGFVEYIKNNQIDLVVSIASPEIFKRELLDAPRKGCINYHASLLPKYRGRQPLFWALLNNESEVGVSIHTMDEQIDGGTIIAQQHISVDVKDSLHALYLKTINSGPQLLVEAIDKMVEDSENISSSFVSLKSPCNSFPGKKDAELFRSRGKSFF